MPRFNVRVTNVREVEMIADIEVDAADESEAEQIAESKAGEADFDGYKHGTTLQWQGPVVESCEQIGGDED